jgi:hypothetical protein
LSPYFSFLYINMSFEFKNAIEILLRQGKHEAKKKKVSFLERTWASTIDIAHFVTCNLIIDNRWKVYTIMYWMRISWNDSTFVLIFMTSTLTCWSNVNWDFKLRRTKRNLEINHLICNYILLLRTHVIRNDPSWQVPKNN